MAYNNKINNLLFGLLIGFVVFIPLQLFIMIKDWNEPFSFVFLSMINLIASLALGIQGYYSEDIQKGGRHSSKL